MIDERNHARHAGDAAKEKTLSMSIRKAVRSDRAAWLDRMAASGDWRQVRALRKGSQAAQGRLTNSTQEIVSSEERAETLAEYLENEQWRQRCIPEPLLQTALGQELPVNLGPVAKKEVQKAVAKMKSNKACGDDGVPPGFWQAVMIEDGVGAEWLVDFCQQCWSQAKVPDVWHIARVACIFKEGDPADCKNYLPISLLSAAYKIFARILLNRLREAGATSI